MHTNEFLSRIQHRVGLLDVKVILDIGSRHAKESESLLRALPWAKAYAFECNPIVLPECYATAAQNKNITIVPKAVCAHDAKVRFYPTESFSHGASSIFKFNPDDPLYAVNPHRAQAEIDVEGTRIDTWCKQNSIESIDLVWMDVQGAELYALEGFGDMLKTVKAIQTEVGIRQVYLGQSLYPDIDLFMWQNGFEKIYEEPYNPEGMDTNVIYVNGR